MGTTDHDEILRTRATPAPRQPFDLREAVADFMARAGQDMPAVPTVPSDAIVRLRLRLIAEEFVELLNACLGEPPAHSYDEWSTWNHLTSTALPNLIDTAPVRVDLTEAADAFADIAYVVEGGCLAFGIDSNAVLAEVHASNMSKFPTTLDANGKVRKAPHYSPPDVAGVLHRLGAK
jgi:predicted HAD superfamily Cof-like phosphohydrolase